MVASLTEAEQKLSNAPEHVTMFRQVYRHDMIQLPIGAYQMN